MKSPKARRVDTAHELAGLLASQSDVLYLPNPGNAGDAAIASATVQLLDRLRLHYACGTPDDVRPGQCVIIGGGGNLVPYYSDVRRILQTCLERQIAKCILLPHSVRGHVDVLAQLDDRFVLMCRDQDSLAFAREHAPKARTVLARDIVMELDIAELERRTATFRHRLALWSDPQWLKSCLRWRLALRRIRPDASGTLVTLRSDAESCNPDRSKRRQDLMRHQGIKYFSAATDQITMDLIDHFRKAQRVVTDRLHVSLLASLLGKPVCLIENSYRKLGDVWETAFDTPSPQQQQAAVRQASAVAVDETLVISLADDHTRQAAMRPQLEALGLDFRFVDAVDGRALTSWPAQYDRRRRLRHFGFDMSPGEIGCFLSHRRIWEHVVKTEKTVLVLEDDALVCPDLLQALHFACNASPTWDLLRLCGARTGPNIRYELTRQGRFALVEELIDPILSLAYVLRPSGARKLLGASRRFFVPVDNFMELRHHNRLRTVSVLPYPVTPMPVASTIGDRQMRNKTLGFRFRRLVFRSYRDGVNAVWIAGKWLDHALRGRWPMRRGQSG